MAQRLVNSNIMGKLLYTLLCLIITTSICLVIGYFVGAFAASSWDVSEWDKELRSIIVFSSFVLSISLTKQAVDDY